MAWPLIWTLFAMAGASIIATDAPRAISIYEGRYMMQDLNSKQNVSELIPLTRDALLRNKSPLEGDLVYLNASTLTSLRDRHVAYISCDLEHYPTNSADPALDMLKRAMDAVNLSAAVFFSTTHNFCSYTEVPVLPHEFPVYSMTDRNVSADVLRVVNDINPALIYLVHIRSIERRQESQPNNPLGPSPSTAVAMIILYSITGLVTSLFLVIIVAGAVRAHRHPERYGPRDILGRPRQSRARGLGRAILDTIPIVKFGEREPQKPTDVEMGPRREVSDAEPVEGVMTEPDQARNQGNAQTPEPAGRTASPGEPEQAREGNVSEERSGIAPAESMGATREGAAEEESLGCAICTDDFVKGQDLRVLPCGHKFHPECVDPWLLNVSGTCPMCRVDLRPSTSRSSNGHGDTDQDGLAPPLQPDDGDGAHRRRSGLRDIVLFRNRPHASAEERISALRRLRDQRRVEQANTQSSAEVGTADQRRSRRLSARLSDVFSSRTRRQHGSQERQERQESREARGEERAEEEQDATMTPSPAATGAIPSAQSERAAEVTGSIVEGPARERSS